MWLMKMSSWHIQYVVMSRACNMRLLKWVISLQYVTYEMSRGCGKPKMYKYGTPPYDAICDLWKCVRDTFNMWLLKWVVHMVSLREIRPVTPCVAVCCSVLQCVAVCCSVLQCVAVCCNDFGNGGGHPATHCNTLQRTATHCNALQRTATHATTDYVSIMVRARHSNVNVLMFMVHQSEGSATCRQSNHANKCAYKTLVHTCNMHS